MGSCLSIHRRGKKESVLILQPDEVADVLKKLANVDERMETEEQERGARSSKYCVLFEIRVRYEEILLVGELPFAPKRDMEMINLVEKIEHLENRLNGI